MFGQPPPQPRYMQAVAGADQFGGYPNQEGSAYLPGFGAEQFGDDMSYLPPADPPAELPPGTMTPTDNTIPPDLTVAPKGVLGYAWKAASIASAGAGAYHGYKRNQSVGWAVVWALLGGVFPVIVPAIALAQGFGKRKVGR